MATVGAGSLYYRPRRTGERKRKSIRGCIVGSDLAVLNLVVIRKGENDVPGLTDADSARPNRLGPKRASHIRKLFVSGMRQLRLLSFCPLVFMGVSCHDSGWMLWAALRLTASVVLHKCDLLQ